MLDQGNPPSREEISKILNDLINDRCSRNDAASWASVWAFQRSDEIDDISVLDALEKLASVDLISTDRPFLYEKVDFKDWLTEFENHKT